MEVGKVYVWQEQIDQMMDQIADEVGDWDEMIDMLAQINSSVCTKEFHDYLEKIMPNIKKHNRKLNRVKYSQDPKGYYVYNYSFDMYRWYQQKKADAKIITDSYFFIGDTELTVKECESFIDKLKSQ